MHIHILGICGTFMGSLALLARAQGHQVSGSDENVYPPMSTQLEEQGITIMQGYAPANLSPRPDLVVIGNAMSRGNPAVEFILDEGLPYTSGPAWLADHVLKGKQVLAVAGTHGKTTTSSILTWILSYAGLKPGYLIGGVTKNLPLSADLGDSALFVVEADEYDTAFFDKRSKFVHYAPRTLILNNLEYDHADIFPDLDAIKRQFHHLLRTVPGNGLILHPCQDKNIQSVLNMGCWTDCQQLGLNVAEKECEQYARDNGVFWNAQMLDKAGSEIEIVRYSQGKTNKASDANKASKRNETSGAERVRFSWSMAGEHNVRNCLAAVAAACHAGVKLNTAAKALQEFKGVARRQELRGEVNGIRVYDDFAHHPTAIAATLSGMAVQLKARANSSAGANPGRLIAVIDPRSSTMRSSTHQKALASCCSAAHMVLWHKPDGLGLDIDGLIKASKIPAHAFSEVDAIVEFLRTNCISGDHVLIMSNGGFGNIHRKLLDVLESHQP